MATSSRHLSPRFSEKAHVPFSGESAAAASVTSTKRSHVVGKGKLNSSTAKAAARVGNSAQKGKTVNKAQEPEYAGVDDVEIRKADGTVTTVGKEEKGKGKAQTANQKIAERASAILKQSGTRLNAVPKAKAAGKTNGKPAVTRGALTAAEKQLEKERQLRLQAEEKLRKQRDDAKAAAKAEKEKARAEAKAKREQEKLDAKAKREQERKEKAEAKQRAKGETGDPVLDAQFHQAVEESRALAARAADTRGLTLGFLGINGVAVTPTGLVLPETLPISDWSKLTGEIIKYKDVAQFAVGDALAYGEAKYGKQYDIVTELLGVERSTVKNYKWVANTWPLAERVPGATFTMHLEAASLYRSDPAAARNLLAQAVANGEQTPWVRKEIQQLRGARTAEPAATQPQTAAVVVDKATKLVALSDEEWESQIATLQPAEREQAYRKEEAALAQYATEHDTIPTDIVRRVLGRVARMYQEAKAEAATWRQRYQDAQAILDRQAEAAARVTEGGAQASVDEDFVGDPLAFLSDEALDEVFGEEEGEEEEES